MWQWLFAAAAALGVGAELVRRTERALTLDADDARALEALTTEVRRQTGAPSVPDIELRHLLSKGRLPAAQKWTAWQLLATGWSESLPHRTRLTLMVRIQKDWIQFAVKAVDTGVVSQIYSINNGDYVYLQDMEVPAACAGVSQSDESFDGCVQRIARVASAMTSTWSASDIRRMADFKLPALERARARYELLRPTLTPQPRATIFGVSCVMSGVGFVTPISISKKGHIVIGDIDFRSDEIVATLTEVTVNIWSNTQRSLLSARAMQPDFQQLAAAIFFDGFDGGDQLGAMLSDSICEWADARSTIDGTVAYFRDTEAGQFTPGDDLNAAAQWVARNIGLSDPRPEQPVLNLVDDSIYGFDQTIYVGAVLSFYSSVVTPALLAGEGSWEPVADWLNRSAPSFADDGQALVLAMELVSAEALWRATPHDSVAGGQVAPLFWHLMLSDLSEGLSFEMFDEPTGMEVVAMGVTRDGVTRGVAFREATKRRPDEPMFEAVDLSGALEYANTKSEFRRRVWDEIERSGQ